MRSYLIPRNVKGETRILTYFTPKSFLFTVIGLVVGTLMLFIFRLMTLKMAGIMVFFIITLISFVIGAGKIPETNILPFFKDTGGESIDDILWRYITFGKKKKIYVYGRREKNGLSK